MLCRALHSEVKDPKINLKNVIPRKEAYFLVLAKAEVDNFLFNVEK